ncbi:hypothetical protein, conserved [Cyanidioschyzon merolae strain 10D]|jgi:cytochrome c oxidase assembly protein subunit 19|uniref:Cytochrome c oxidase assembly protein COX19 n=1 Tax=Cyanidioschyzon merolae (strain NIES-3377 / 10D) TaxID=280699 RepID=M1V998_CYAM1|nr:hypothetical protein, conserved [Cyanidioschyzon merolae strain 10D]BAM81304.1 hypothetical protein, conserved [Cyanidioschyzon merolae strain 10D]|eukprot:XP_005537340.1 hypothetical protein, conserved [Cyanidioschyzon merolae strain 10D]
MTTSNALSGGKPSRPSPPEKGSFPLDREGLCADFARAVIRCLREREGRTAACRGEELAYLECRMNHGLMTPESPADLGFDEENDRALSAVNERDDGKEQLKVSDGAYVAGLRYHRSRRRHREQEGQRPGSSREESPEG